MSETPTSSSTMEHENTNIWTYDHLKQRLKKVVLEGDEIGEEEFPNSIDFGTLARETDNMVIKQNADSSRREQSRIVGVEKDEPNALNFSKVTTGTTTGFEGTNLTAEDYFLPETLQKLGGLIFAMHSHPHILVPVFSPSDLTLLRLFAGISVGSGSDINQLKKLFVLRSRNTHNEFVEGFSDEEMIRVKKQGDVEMMQRYPSEFSEITGITQDVSMNSYLHPLLLLTEERAKALNSAYDRVIRREAQRQALIYYEMKPGATIATRSDLSKPLFSVS